MTNNLSQEEKDALLSGSDSNKPVEEPDKTPVQEPDEGAEDAGTAGNTGKLESDPDSEEDLYEGYYEDLITDEEKDILGEIGNISMGTSATTLNTLLGKSVSITTPNVAIATLSEVAAKAPLPFVGVEVGYTKGLLGNNVLFIQTRDVKIITDLLMGGDGTNIPEELSELHLSAISEVMNQMVGSASTSIAKIIGQSVDISPPKAYGIDFGNEDAIYGVDPEKPMITTSFRMKIGDLVNSEIMQIMPVEFGKQLVDGLRRKQRDGDYGGSVGSGYGYGQTSGPEDDAAESPPAASAANSGTPQAPRKEKRTAAPSGPVRARPVPEEGRAHRVMSRRPRRPHPEQEVVNVHAMEYQSFEDENVYDEQQMDNIDILMDVPLQVTVELGKSKKHIKEILDFNVGSIIVLDKLAGELVDIVVNGKLIAKAEVVVIDDNYGARITDIITPEKRFEGGV